MKIYHTETQADYDALMVELEEQGYKWNSGSEVGKVPNYWISHKNEMCVMVDCCGYITYGKKSYFELSYQGTPIIKYKQNVGEKMKIYHTETQKDYDALMVELEVKGIGTLGKRYWEVYENQTVVIVHAIGPYGDNSRTDTTYGSLEWALKNYLTAPQKYKAKADEKMRFTKENVLDLTDKWIENKTVSFQDLQNEIKELDDTPEKVVVPKCFDEWFKEIVFEYPITDSSKRFALWKLSQQGFGCGFERANGEKIPYDTDLGKWLFQNRELAINAILNGYTIERERFYCIPLPHLETADGTKQYLTKSGAGNYLALSPCIGQKQRYTKEELEQVPEIYKPFAKLIEEEE